MPHIPIVVISGGPQGGKSTLLARAHAWLTETGVPSLVISDTAAELMAANVSLATCEPELYYEKLLLRTLEREERCIHEVNQWGAPRSVILCEGGALDAAAYLDYGTFQQMIARHGYTRIKVRHRYDLVLHLASAATSAEARSLDASMRVAWLGHRYHYIIDNSTDFEMKMHRALCTIARVLRIPEPTTPESEESAAWARALARA